MTEKAAFDFPKEAAISFFPKYPPRNLQVAVVKEVEGAMKAGKRIIIVEAPVGSGKSPVAITFAQYFGEAHVITPRKTLQDQYFEDFSEMLVTMKGRSSYPCTIDSSPAKYRSVIREIKAGATPRPSSSHESTANGPCKGSKTVYQYCQGKQGPCPYTVAIESAQQSPIVVHNIHSFVFQTQYAEKFLARKVMIVDEAHEIEGTLRGFCTKKFRVPNRAIDAGDIPDLKGLEEWATFFSKDVYVPEEDPVDTARRIAAEALGEVYLTDRSRYLESVQVLNDNAAYVGEEFTVKRQIDMFNGRVTGTSFEFIPHSIGTAAQRLLFDYGDYVLLLSGTIYDKNVFCRNIGINPDEAYFIRVPSTFPVKNRPIYAKAEYQTDTSFANWSANFGEMTAILNKILGKFHDVKGLIHAPSYESALEIARYLPKGRAMVHDKGNFQEKLNEFYASEEPKVFISPVCQQGVDFKYDRARFQVIIRIPYLNTSDEFVNYMVKNNFPWYNHQALVVFGQQIGRVNRADDDFGATFLLDSRFNSFLQKNSTKLPAWLKSAIVY